MATSSYIVSAAGAASHETGSVFLVLSWVAGIAAAVLFGVAITRMARHLAAPDCWGHGSRPDGGDLLWLGTSMFLAGAAVIFGVLTISGRG